jgi:hypothetical protein
VLMQGNPQIALTLLRCVGWLSRDDLSTRRGHAGPYMATPGASCREVGCSSIPSCTDGKLGSR